MAVRVLFGLTRFDIRPQKERKENSLDFTPRVLLRHYRYSFVSSVSIRRSKEIRESPALCRRLRSLSTAWREGHNAIIAMCGACSVAVRVIRDVMYGKCRLKTLNKLVNLDKIFRITRKIYECAYVFREKGSFMQQRV